MIEDDNLFAGEMERGSKEGLEKGGLHQWVPQYLSMSRVSCVMYVSMLALTYTSTSAATWPCTCKRRTLRHFFMFLQTCKLQ